MTNFSCTKCQSTFDTKYKMKKHVDQQHREDGRTESDVWKIYAYQMAYENESMTFVEKGAYGHIIYDIIYIK